MVTRAEVVKEALSWLETPYHLGARVKGAGIDCATFLYCVYQTCGIIREDDQFIERYSHDWFRNTTDDRYAMRALRYAYKVAEGVCNRTLKPEPGNFLLAKAVNSNLYNHGGIVVSWPTIIHAVDPEVETVCAVTHRLWSYRDVLILDPWAKMEAMC